MRDGRIYTPRPAASKVGGRNDAHLQLVNFLIFMLQNYKMRPCFASELLASVTAVSRSQTLNLQICNRTRFPSPRLRRTITTTPRRNQDAAARPAPQQQSSQQFNTTARAPNSAAKPSNTLSQTSTDSNGSLRSLTDGLSDPPPTLSEDEKQVDWTRSFHGLSAAPFSPDQAAILTQELEFDDIEIKPDGIVYLPEIKYRRILNKAFGPGGWGLAPRGETIVTGKVVTREYGLVAGGR